MADTTTKCPNCETAFRVTEEQLAAANGMVRCGKCMGIFNASDNQISVEEPEENLPRLTALIHNEFTEQQPGASSKKRTGRPVGKNCGICPGRLILAGQYVYFFSGPLSQNQNYRQLLMDSCQQSLAAKSSLFATWTNWLSTPLLQSHPSQPNAVMVDLLIENSAGFSQAYPGIKIRFEDLNGRW